jgi:hypothetical protein
MRFLKLFEQKSYEEHVAEICQRYNIRNWSINSEGLVDVNGNVYLSRKRLTKLPLNFGHVGGNFYCSSNQLTNLAGCPHTVSGNFSCAYNIIISLEGPLHTVSGNFSCSSNIITSLEGGPQSVGGNFWCFENDLDSLRFSPEEVGGEVRVLPNPITDIPKKYLTEKCLQFIVKEQYDWNLYRKDGSMRLDRLEQMIEWGIETNKIKPL